MSLKLSLVGFPGVGKSEVLKRLLDDFGLAGVDLDAEIGRVYKKAVPDIIRVEGEEVFRRLEAEVLKSLLLKRDEIKVISLGGGTLLKKENRELLLANSFLAELKAPNSEIAKRVLEDELSFKKEGFKGPKRPILIDANRELSYENVLNSVNSLKESRKGLYDICDFRIWTHLSTPERISRVLYEEFNRALKGKKREVLFSQISQKDINQEFISSSDDFCFGELISIKNPSIKKIALLIDENVYSFWKDEIINSLSNFELFVYVVPSGEESKSFFQYQKILDKLLEFGITRKDLVLACGGGVCGDLGGFIASTFMRGVNLVHIPTTLVSQVDSSIGGKTGINLEGGKNLVGSFYPASLIISDSLFLKTLPEREFKAGLAEVIKYGLIKSKEFYFWLVENMERIVSREPESLREVIAFSARVKFDVVSIDLEDKLGHRALLNFGHTLGHAIENLAGYGTYLHGEAVSIGMVFALKLGEELGLTEVGLSGAVSEVLKGFGLPVKISSEVLESYSSEVLEKSLLADKKRVSNFIDYVIVRKIGDSITKEVEVEEVVKLIKSCAI